MAGFWSAQLVWGSLKVTFMATTASPQAESSSDALAKLRISRTERPTQRSWFRWLLGKLLLLVVLAGIVGGGLGVANKVGWISNSREWLALPDFVQPRPEVRLATVSAETGRSAEALVVATGYLESRRQAKIGARAPGRIELLHVEEGSRVQMGEVLAVLEHADLEASLAAVKSSLERGKAALAEQEIVIAQSKRELERANRLKNSNVVGEAELEDKRFKYESSVARRASLAADISLAEARVREAEQMKANMFIRAPFNGTVISKDAEVGESILPGGMGEASGRGSAVTVADLDHLEVECDVKEDYISRVVPDQNAEVAVDAVPTVRFQGRVRKIIPMGDRARATIKVKVEIINADERLFPNMSATVYFLPAESAAPTKPATRRVFCDTAAIQADSSGSFVWVLDERERIRRIEIKTGTERDKSTEVTDGLSGGERVVIVQPGLQAGQLVKIGR